VAWVFVISGPLLMAGYFGYICQGRPAARMTEQQFQETQILPASNPTRTTGLNRAEACPVPP
jgi:hypothetical protein